MNSLHGGILLLPYILGFGITGIALAKFFSKSKPTDRILLTRDENGVWKDRGYDFEPITSQHKKQFGV